MINLDSIINKKWPFISGHTYRILIICDSGSGKTNAMLNLIKEQEDIDKIYLCEKDLSEPKLNFLSKSMNMQQKNISNTQMHLLSAQTLWMVFIRIQPKQKKKKFNCT